MLLLVDQLPLEAELQYVPIYSDIEKTMKQMLLPEMSHLTELNMRSLALSQMLWRRLEDSFFSEWSNDYHYTRIFAHIVAELWFHDIGMDQVR